MSFWAHSMGIYFINRSAQVLCCNVITNAMFMICLDYDFVKTQIPVRMNFSIIMTVGMYNNIYEINCVYFFGANTIEVVAICCGALTGKFFSITVLPPPVPLHSAKYIEQNGHENRLGNCLSVLNSLFR